MQTYYIIDVQFCTTTNIINKLQQYFPRKPTKVTLYQNHFSSTSMNNTWDV